MRAALESLLRARKLDVTVAPFGPAGEPLAPMPDQTRVAPTGGEAVALVDVHDTFDPASASAYGVDLSHLLWVRPGSHDLAIALKAYALVLQAGGFGLAVLDLADAASAALRQLPVTTWMR